MKPRRRPGVWAVAVSLLLCLPMTACGAGGGSGTPPFDPDAVLNRIDDGTVAENDTYRLQWDGENARVILTDKATGLSWSTTPPEALTERVDEDGFPVATHPLLRSPLSVEYLEENTFLLRTTSAYAGSIAGGTVSVETVEAGVRATYVFPDIAVSVPVLYTLHADGFSMAVDTAAIRESGNAVTRITLAPFLCAVGNDCDDGYLFIPSGSGALIYPKQLDALPAVYSQEVYGEDASRYKEGIQQVSAEKNVLLPVFGVKDRQQALFAVIDGGTGAASIEASVGSKNIGYSGVSASFAVRGYQWVKKGGAYNRLYTEAKADTVCSVRYYPLSGEAADYSAMAALYSDILFADKPAIAEPMLGLKLLGGTMLKKSFLGLPYEDLFALTTAAEAEAMIREVVEKTGFSPAVDLQGFGKQGLDSGEIAGGFTVSGRLGGEAGLKRLAEACRELAVPLYMDFDLLHFRRGGSGISALGDKARDVSGKTTDQYAYAVWSGTRNYAFDRFFLVARGKLSGLTDRLIERAGELGLPGVGLETLSTVSYSDYREERYAVKGDMDADVAALMERLRGGGFQIAVNEANGYAAAAASQIFDAPLQSTRHDVFDESIPFYQMVFKGRVPLLGEALNLAADSQAAVLRCVESGCGFAFQVMHNTDTALLDASPATLYASYYADVLPAITRLTQAHGRYLQAVAGARIVRHELLPDGLRRTVFSNGTTVVVNDTGQPQTYDGETIGGCDYLLREAAA